MHLSFIPMKYMEDLFFKTFKLNNLKPVVLSYGSKEKEEYVIYF